MDSYAAAVWEETLLNEERQQMKDWESRNQGANNPLDFTKNPIPAHLVKKTDVSQAPMMMPRDAPVDTKNPFQIRDPKFVIPGDPANKQKFYTGRKTRRPSCELPGVHSVSVPGITHGQGGISALSPEAQAKVMHYPPPNPLAKKSQSTPGTTLPGSTTFGFGYNFTRAERDAPPGAKPQFRPPDLPGELKLKYV